MGRAAKKRLTEPHIYDPERDARVRLRAATVRGPGVLRLTWSDDVTRDVDLSGNFTGSALAKMLAIPEVFRDFEIEEGGHGLRWINGVDFCADALRILADKQRAGIA